MINFIDSLFAPILQFLDLMAARIAGIGSIAAKGIRLDDYFGFFSLIGPEWTGVITSLITAILFLYTLEAIQSQSGVLMWFKKLFKWW